MRVVIEIVEGLVRDVQPRRLCYTVYAVFGGDGVRDSSAALGMTVVEILVNRRGDGYVDEEAEDGGGCVV